MRRCASRHFAGALVAIAGTTCGASAAADVFRQVEVRGAEFIPEADIQMTCGAQAGVDYSVYEIEAIEDCLMSTGVFEAVSVSGEGETLVIAVSEIDDSPGRIEAAVNYVSDDGFLAELSAEKYNLFPDTYGALRLSANADVRALEANLYRADQWGEDWDLGLDVIAREAKPEDAGYSERGLRIEPFVAWTPSEDLRLEAGLGWRDYRLADVDSEASALLIAEETGSISAPYLRFGLSFGRNVDLGDNPSGWAKAGYMLRLDQFIWNIGSGEALSDTRFDLTTQLPLGERIRLLTGLRGGAVRGLDGNDTRAIDRYFPGADTFRGFAPRGVGPRDEGTALGGNTYVVGSLEAQRDLGRVLRLPMRAGIFLDTGASWDLDDDLGGRIDDGWSNRSSVGLSLTFEVSETPVSLYVAGPVSQRPGDETQAFGISFAARF
ncbi:hypothetical protein RISW2_04895 [Roseivivax isoporae LMG 25204]|uniref:Bacterial surface antigen (D15) domain-containing protein n=1 Tax=Roseivivax isoporae LMG 25204 TaxID=1449351 RepID=X7F9Q1_9RHOB|nr:hypothetical protein RISW2_04895 [Roseivivax isoporae LMG 25204]